MTMMRQDVRKKVFPRNRPETPATPDQDLKDLYDMRQIVDRVASRREKQINIQEEAEKSQCQNRIFVKNC